MRARIAGGGGGSRRVGRTVFCTRIVVNFRMKSSSRIGVGENIRVGEKVSFSVKSQVNFLGVGFQE